MINKTNYPSERPDPRDESFLIPIISCDGSLQEKGSRKATAAAVVFVYESKLKYSVSVPATSLLQMLKNWP